MSHDALITAAEFISEHLPTFGRSDGERVAREILARSAERKTADAWEADYEALARDGAEPTRKCARIEYTVETRRGPVRRAREVSARPDRLGDLVERAVDKLVDGGAFNFDVRYEV